MSFSTPPTARKSSIGLSAPTAWTSTRRPKHKNVFVRPDGMDKHEAAETQEWHGPFTTEAEVRESQRVTLLGSQCKVIEGGMWDDAWDKPQ